MKQKRWFRAASLVFCIAVAGALWGCSGGSGEQEKTTSGGAENAATSQSADRLIYDPAEWPKVTPYEAEPLLKADPDAEAYISLQNQDCDFYPDSVYVGVAFDIITKKAYRPEEIKVVFPGKTKYEVSVTDRSDVFQHIGYTHGGGHQDGQQFYHYLVIKDTDLLSLGQMKSDAGMAGAVYNKASLDGTFLSEEDRDKLLGTYVESYNALYREYMDEYTAQGDKKLTEYSAYTVHIDFNKKTYTDETVEWVDVLIGDQVYHMEFGQWRIHSEPLDAEASNTGQGLLMATEPKIGTPWDSPYAEGYMKLEDAARFTTTEEVMLTGMRFESGRQMEMLGAKIVNSAQGGSADFYWDGSSALRLESGAVISLSLYLYSESFKEFENNMAGAFYIDYVLPADGTKHTAVIPYKVTRWNELWDSYCMTFLGVDVGEYYHYFRDEVIGIGWTGEIPEGWRKQ